MRHGMQGVGIYWCIVEMLYEESGYLPLEYERITFELRDEKNVIRSVIEEFDLFKIEGEMFYSEAVLERLKKRLCPVLLWLTPLHQKTPQFLLQRVI